MKTLLLLLTMPLFAHVPCKQWEIIETTINGQLRQTSFCPEWDESAPCPEAKTIRDTITLHDTIWLQAVALDCPEVSGNRQYSWREMAAEAALIVFFVFVANLLWLLLKKVRRIILNIIERMRYGS